MMNNKLWKRSKDKTCLFFQSEPQQGWKVAGEPSCGKFAFLILFTAAAQVFEMTSARGRSKGRRQYMCDFLPRWGGDKIAFSTRNAVLMSDGLLLRTSLHEKTMATVRPVTA